MERLLENPDDEVRYAAEELLKGIDQVHREAIARLANLLDHHGMLQQAAADPLIGQVLDLYDLLPLDESSQVDRALDEVRPYIHSHGGQIELLEVSDGIVRLRLAGACSGCSGSAMTLRRGVEAALREGFPGFLEMVVEEPAPTPARPTFIGLEQIKVVAPPVRPVFEDAAAVDDVQGMVTVDVKGVPVLLHNLDGEIFAFRLGGSRRESFPVAVEEGRVKVAVNVPAEAPTPR